MTEPNSSQHCGRHPPATCESWEALCPSFCVAACGVHCPSLLLIHTLYVALPQQLIRTFALTPAKTTVPHVTAPHRNVNKHTPRTCLAMSSLITDLYRLDIERSWLLSFSPPHAPTTAWPGEWWQLPALRFHVHPRAPASAPPPVLSGPGNRRRQPSVRPTCGGQGHGGAAAESAAAERC